MIKIVRITYFFSVVMLFLLTACNQTTTDLLPVVNTEAISQVTQTTAKCGGTVVSDGGSAITARGVCWSTLPEVSIKNNISTDSTGIGSYASSVTDLSAATTYYVRAYATTANGTAYGNVLQITTLPDPTAPSPILNTDLTYGTTTDIDGNTYHTITIGTQTWMAENLIVTKYRNGDAIPIETDNAKWNKLTTGAQSIYNNNWEANSVGKFGRFYNYYAVSDTRNLAPEGWHIPTNAEWNTLTNYLASHLGISTSVAQALAAKTDWVGSSLTGAIGTPDPNSYSLNNSSGFSGLPSGFRGDYGAFSYVTIYCAWWSSTQNDNTSAWFRSLNYYGLNTGKNTYSKHYGLSVRCVKN